MVLGMLPLARELLKMGCEVVLTANSLPAINDITAQELRELVQRVAEMCPTIKASAHRDFFTPPEFKDAPPAGHRVSALDSAPSETPAV